MTRTGEGEQVRQASGVTERRRGVGHDLEWLASRSTCPACDDDSCQACHRS